MAPESPKKAAQPGRLGAKTHYPPEEAVIQMRVPQKAIEAREYVKREFTVDILGRRGPQYTLRVDTPKSKFSHRFADMTLGNTLLPAHIDPSDFRTLKGSTFRGTGTKVLHAYDRGEYTAGWNHATSFEGRELRQGLAALDEAAKRSRQAALQRIEASYKPLTERYEEQLQSIREAKLSGTWDPKTGTHIAAAVDAPKPKPRRAKPTAWDMQAVSELDSFVPPDDRQHPEQGEEGDE